jgi:AraC-like DNA-binding protein
MSKPAQKAIIYTSPNHSLYIGRLEPVLRRVNVSSTLLVSIDNEMELTYRDSQKSIRGKSFLIPAGVDTRLFTHGAIVAWCFLDDLGTDLARLAPHMKPTPRYSAGDFAYSCIPNEGEIARQAADLYTQRPETREALALLDNWMGVFPTRIPANCDDRVAKAVAIIKTNYRVNISVGEIARQVNLSVPRLIQLFKQVTGTPIRRFRLWHRILITATRLTEGYSLTEAAIAAGFADYAQFSRVYRELVGGSPAAARDNTEIRPLAGRHT